MNFYPSRLIFGGLPISILYFLILGPPLVSRQVGFFANIPPSVLLKYIYEGAFFSSPLNWTNVCFSWSSCSWYFPLFFVLVHQSGETSPFISCQVVFFAKMTHFDLRKSTKNEGGGPLMLIILSPLQFYNFSSWTVFLFSNKKMFFCSNRRGVFQRGIGFFLLAPMISFLTTSPEAQFSVFLISFSNKKKDHIFCIFAIFCRHLFHKKVVIWLYIRNHDLLANIQVIFWRLWLGESQRTLSMAF